MATYRALISWALDTALPRDRVSVTPHFVGDNPGALADAIVANLIALSTHGGTTAVQVKIYDALKAKPNPPLATRDHAGTNPASTKPRELALCLSYYSTYNQPRYRGRLYIPNFLITGQAASRPTAQQMTDAISFASVMKNGMPPNTNWVLWSKTRQKADGVSNYWVDDEWDVMRSRGLRGTTRSLGTVP